MLLGIAQRGQKHWRVGENYDVEYVLGLLTTRRHAHEGENRGHKRVSSAARAKLTLCSLEAYFPVRRVGWRKHLTNFARGYNGLQLALEIWVGQEVL